MRDYEFHIYSSDANGAVSADAAVSVVTCVDDRAATTVARKLARSASGPIDVARKGAMAWNDRYVGTASRKWPEGPSLATIFERLD